MRNFREMREMLRAMQAGELTVSRGIEILEMWSAGNWNDNMLPPVRQDLIEEDSTPVEIIDRLKAKNEQLKSLLREALSTLNDQAGHVAAVLMRCGHEIDQLRSELAALKAENESLKRNQWQPIETAPKDGTVFLGYKLGQFRECYKVPRDDCDMWCFGGTSGADDLFPNIKPTHWMPLPKAPANGASS